LPCRRAAPRSGTQGVNVTALREIKLLMELKHPNIIRLIDVFPHKRNLNLVRARSARRSPPRARLRRLPLTPASVCRCLSSWRVTWRL
jgi:hypothetical protein